MKKVLSIFVFGAFMWMGHSANAQAGFQLGVKGGLNFANIQTDVSTEGSTGFHAGAFAMIKVSKIGIQPELLYSTQSTELNFATAQELKTSYVNIPIMVKFYLIQGLNIQAGPQFGFATLSEVTEVGNSGTTDDIKDDLKGSDVSLALGAGVDLPFGLSVTARYNLGLSDLNDQYDFDLDPATDEELKNQVFQVSIGYALLKK